MGQAALFAVLCCALSTAAVPVPCSSARASQAAANPVFPGGHGCIILTRSEDASAGRHGTRLPSSSDPSGAFWSKLLAMSGTQEHKDNSRSSPLAHASSPHSPSDTISGFSDLLAAHADRHRNEHGEVSSEAHPQSGSDRSKAPAQGHVEEERKGKPTALAALAGLKPRKHGGGGVKGSKIKMPDGWKPWNRDKSYKELGLPPEKAPGFKVRACTRARTKLGTLTFCPFQPGNRPWNLDKKYSSDRIRTNGTPSKRLGAPRKNKQE